MNTLRVVHEMSRLTHSKTSIPIVQYTVERFCKTKIRTKFRDGPCENVYERSHELITLCSTHFRTFARAKCTYAMTRKFISRSLQVSRPKLRKFVRSFSLHDIERKFVRIFVSQNLSSTNHTVPIHRFIFLFIPSN